jgi:hypothetical protein
MHTERAVEHAQHTMDPERTQHLRPLRRREAAKPQTGRHFLQRPRERESARLRSGVLCQERVDGVKAKVIHVPPRVEQRREARDGSYEHWVQR